MISKIRFLKKSLIFEKQLNYISLNRDSTQYKNLEIIENPQKKYELLFRGKKMKTPSKKSLIIANYELAKEIVRELQQEKQDIVFETTLFDLTTSANEKDNDNDLRSFYQDFVKDYFRKDAIYIRRPDDTELGVFQKENFSPLMQYLEEAIKIKIQLNYFDQYEDFKENEILLIKKYLDSCDNCFLTAVENIVNVTKSSALAIGILKDLIPLNKMQSFNEMEQKYGIKLYGKHDEAHEDINENNFNFLTKTKKFYDIYN